MSHGVALDELTRLYESLSLEERDELLQGLLIAASHGSDMVVRRLEECVLELSVRRAIMEHGTAEDTPDEMARGREGMNEITLGGTFATEVALDQDTDGVETASFIVRVARPDVGEDFFRVISSGPAAAVIRQAAENRLLRGEEVQVVGRLAQDTVVDSAGQSAKVVRVVAEQVKIGD